MLNNNEQVKVETQKAIDKAMELVTASIHSVEKLTRIQLEASRQILEDTTKALKDIAGLSDAKEVAAKVSEMAANTVEKNIASARDVYEVISEVGAKVSKLAEENVQAAQKAALNSVDGLSKYNPSSAQAVSEAVKSWMSNANQAMSAVSKVASQVTEYASSNLNAATNATVTAVKKAVNKAN
ncbi:MAG: phasin family protein [Neisseriaceae bacterium]|nr:MAG: phasin family protein [Neisseriaceae bacterium]